MKTTLVIAFLFSLFVTADAAQMDYTYKPGEFLVIKAGESPDKKFCIVAGKNEAGEFGVYLMDRQTKKVLGELKEVETSWDTAPEAYGARWSPDSKHVGITSRGDRRWVINVIYRIDNQRAFLVETPKLLCHAVPDFCGLMKELGGALMLFYPSSEQQRQSYEMHTNDDVDVPWKVRQMSSHSWIVKWTSPTRFTVGEEADFQVKDRDPAASLGKYGEVEKFARKIDDPVHPEDLGNNDLYQVSFEAEGECELLPGDKSRVLKTQSVDREKSKEN